MTETTTTAPDTSHLLAPVFASSAALALLLSTQITDDEDE